MTDPTNPAVETVADPEDGCQIAQLSDQSVPSTTAAAGPYSGTSGFVAGRYMDHSIKHHADKRQLTKPSPSSEYVIYLREKDALKNL